MESRTLFADILLPLPVPGTFTYRVPAAMNELVMPGIRAVVQFGTRKVYTGLITAVHDRPPSVTPKYLVSLLDEVPVVNDLQLRFWEWISSYYLCTRGEVMNAALPSALKLASETRVALNPSYTGDLQYLSEREQLLVEALGHRQVLSLTDISKILDQQKVIPVIRTMIEKGVVILEEEIRERVKPRVEKFITLDPAWSGDEEAMKELFDTLESRAHKQLEVLMSFLHLTRFKPGDTPSLSRSVLLEKITGGAAALHALVKKNVFNEEEHIVSRLDATDAEAVQAQVRLTSVQERAMAEIRQSFEDKDVTLLHGVTSSGKTELYIRLISETLEAGRQALYLLPEIALTTQIITRLRKYFGNRIGIYHSRFNEQERVEVWNRLLEKKYDVILGARSAVFLPFSNLGLVIADEEHDYSFKQVDPAPRYNGRDAALFLAHLHGAKALLGSATPAIETYYLAKTGKYGLVELHQRYGDMQMPAIQVVDIKDQLRQGKMKTHFSSVLIESLGQALKNHEQAILFQNRRGFSLRLECETCHWMPSCKNCDVTLVYHKKSNQLRCHYCGYSTGIPTKCPECSGVHIRMKGFGTERVEEDLQILFPQARISRMDLDTTRSKNAHEKIIREFEERKIDFMVGTQMVTKGLDFDHVSTVCVLNADNMLSYPDFRSPERSFQLMAQVSGRSGRKNKQGRVIIQTWQPSHPIILDVVNHDYASMYVQQVNDRKKFGYPPFVRLVVLRLKHRDPDLLTKAAERLAVILRKEFGTRVLGPEYPVVARIMSLYIKNIMVKLERGATVPVMKEKLSVILEQFRQHKEFSQVRIITDVDPL